MKKSKPQAKVCNGTTEWVNGCCTCKKAPKNMRFPKMKKKNNIIQGEKKRAQVTAKTFTYTPQI